MLEDHLDPFQEAQDEEPWVKMAHVQHGATAGHGSAAVIGITK
jgi:hypothetical protein